MTLIAIEQSGGFEDSPNARLSFDRRGSYDITVRDPFSPEEEARLEWYFEEHIRFPVIKQVLARQAAESIRPYGERLFEQVFAERRAYSRYSLARQQGVSGLSFEIVGEPEFHRLHWEALKDPDLPQAFALDAIMVRSTIDPPLVEAHSQESPTINLLVVTARPGGRHDVGYRTISRPLVEGLRRANLPVRVEIVRPGTYQALLEHLEMVTGRRGPGYYHLIHFDLHGALLSYAQFQRGVESNQFLYQARFGRDDLEPYEGLKAFLSFEGEQEGQSDPAEAGELAGLLQKHHIPIAVLNACQSGKQVGVNETSLGSRLLQAGVQTVLAMGYSVTVSAAGLLMEKLYAGLFGGEALSAAIRQGRAGLSHRKERSAYFNQQVDLEDWLLPVVYQSGGAGADPPLPLRPFRPEEEADWLARQAGRYRAPEPGYGFVGRDLDILQIERRLLARSQGRQRNLLLVRGMGGAGKTSLLHHLAGWWQATGFVDEVFYFGYDEKAWSLAQILDTMARRLLVRDDRAGDERFSPGLARFRGLAPAAQQQFLAQRLRGERHLLILDNMESITGAHLAIRNTLPAEERAALARFLADLLDGESLVLLGSRGGEEWLRAGRPAPLRAGEDVYDLPGLDPEAASTLAERVLARHLPDPERRAGVRQSQEFGRLLRLLDGYPLPLEVVLANLGRQSPAEVLAALHSGSEAIDFAGESKTESILKCIDYSHSNLSPEAQGLLLCLAPFNNVIFTGAFDHYTERLRQQPALAGLPFERWPEVWREAEGWGLLAPHQTPGYLRLQPVLPYFLQARLNAARPELRQAIETAFREHYTGLGRSLGQLLQSKEPRERQAGQVMAGLEYENLAAALDLALQAHTSILNIIYPLSLYLDAVQDHRRGLELGEMVLARLEDYPAGVLAGPVGAEFAGVIDNIARRQLSLKRYQEAGASYQKALAILLRNESYSPDQIRQLSASLYHQLGLVVEAQRQWPQAEAYYRQALQIYIDFDDRYEQAGTYHQLGIVAEEQRQWPQAEAYYQQALQIYIDFDDRYEQAKTYHQLGSVAQAQRQWPQAEAYYRQALQIKIDFDDRYEQAKTYHQLGIVAQKQRQWPQAEAYYQQALQIKIDFDDRYSQAATYHQLGVVAAEQRQWPQAGEYFLNALTIFTDYKDSHSRGIVMRSLARLWRAGGDTTLPQAIARVLGQTPEEVERLLRELAAGDEAEDGPAGD